ncbi:hypothetical protein HN51_012011 [Arachis hypogaea]|nr:uncharacterized protein DS421_3g82170 [Arachis hypogaea]
MFRSNSHEYPQYSNYSNPTTYERTIYEEDSYGRHNHNHHHHQPETRERVEVVEYEKMPEYGTREVVYEEVETNRNYPHRHGHYGL